MSLYCWKSLTDCMKTNNTSNSSITCVLNRLVLRIKDENCTTNTLIRPYGRILCLMESLIFCLDLVIMLFSYHKRLHLSLHCNIVALYDIPRNLGSEIRKRDF